MKKIAISIGDINGISVELLAKTHKELCKICIPFYFVHKNLLKQGLKLANLGLKNVNLVEFHKGVNDSFKPIKKGKKFNIYSYTSAINFEVCRDFKIRPGQVSEQSGMYSFLSFAAANNFVAKKRANALVTLPINKEAWSRASIEFKGHTEFLRKFYNKQAIMMLGCKELFVGLFTEHIALNEVSSKIEFKALCEFFYDFYKESKFKKIGVLGFNPHASDNGVIGGREELIIKKAIKFTNAYINFLNTTGDTKELKEFLDNENLQNEIIKHKKNVFIPYPLVADTAFLKANLKHCNRLIAMYHDLGLAPLKALYFEKSINVSLNLPIIRTSVDHGTAFDKAFKGLKLNTKSYKQAVKFAIKLSSK
ncbi:4-hydroxythreonine-4-phosphate dehydrogenase [Campylobacter sp. LR286c]|uniref:4-hydroxythreonine-4-phosphate dehydrogenase n=1 Tax=Campylobacter sp. LR286c TaxID=2593545 RepID=UPI001237D1A8|nr:4-hydroxythreonine-4-phosphate dehydrogenase [Campylobacter sp. LR286c]KAA6227339.1 4-hydroxythreonine-4-phosphate dehydrogenase [Campylobacter sp. LR286c]